jgi:hypothetical protein
VVLEPLPSVPLPLAVRMVPFSQEPVALLCDDGKHHVVPACANAPTLWCLSLSSRFCQLQRSD